MRSPHWPRVLPTLHENGCRRSLVRRSRSPWRGGGTWVRTNLNSPPRIPACPPEPTHHIRVIPSEAFFSGAEGPALLLLFPPKRDPLFTGGKTSRLQPTARKLPTCRLTMSENFGTAAVRLYRRRDPDARSSRSVNASSLLPCSPASSLPANASSESPPYPVRCVRHAYRSFQN